MRRRGGRNGRNGRLPRPMRGRRSVPSQLPGPMLSRPDGGVSSDDLLVLRRYSRRLRLLPRQSAAQQAERLARSRRGLYQRVLLLSKRGDHLGHRDLLGDVRGEAAGKVHGDAAHREARDSRRFGLRSEDRSRRYAHPEGVARALARRHLPPAAVLVVVVEVVRGARGAAGGVRASRGRLPEDVRRGALVKSGGALVEVDHRSEVVGVRAAHDEPAPKLAPRGSGLGARGSGGRRGVEPSRRGRWGVVLAIVHRP